MRITMVGTGYVGLVTGTCLATTGNDVTCLDIDQTKINQLKKGISPIYEPGLDELIQRNAKAGRLHFTTDKQAAYQLAEIVFICVGTPSNEKGQASVDEVMGVAAEIGQAMEASPGSTGGDPSERRAKSIVVKSTVPVGTNAKVQSEIAARTPKAFRMASNPEFLKEGAAINDFMKPDRVIIGVDDKGTGDRLRDLYDPFVRQGNPIFVMDIRSAEMVKYASNAMLATKISFINEIAALCEALGADIDEVRRGMCSDSRIGNKFLYPGLGYGGSCFPKDVLACITMGSQNGAPASLLAAVHEVNQRQREAFIRKIDRHFGHKGHQPQSASDRAKRLVPKRTLKDKRIAIWGIAFKPGTDDVREAPSITLMEQLLERGATIVAHDPAATATAQRILGDRITCVDTPYDALDGAHALVICTDWDDFKHPDLEQMKERMKEQVIFDGRNLYRPKTMSEYGFTYHSVGRDPVVPV